jgi:hypothetical protein
MSITLSDYLKPNISVPVDYRQGPFATTTVANATVNVNYRYTGLTVLITNGSTVDEYWWKAGTADEDLVLKTTGGSAYTLPVAGTLTLGGVKVGTGLSIDTGGILSSTITQYSLPTASTSTLGGVKVGTGLSIDANGILSSSITQYSLPTASTSTLGGVKVGTGLSIDANGILSSTITQYSLPTATSSVLGGIKIGTGLTISSGTAALAATGVNAGTYTNAKITVNTYGQITSASSGLDPIIASLIF